MAKKKVSKKKVIKRSKSKPKPKIKKVPRWSAVPLKGSFMVMSILGFLLSYYYVYPLSVSFGAACMIIFVIMFVAALISMTKAPIKASVVK
ncbi:hypothetical protein ACFL0E_01000 [Nanoarchaeota archaeon]